MPFAPMRPSGSLNGRNAHYGYFGYLCGRFYLLACNGLRGERLRAILNREFLSISIRSLN